MITSNLTLHIKISSGFENLSTNCKYLNEFQGLNTNTQEKKKLGKTPELLHTDRIQRYDNYILEILG